MQFLSPVVWRCCFGYGRLSARKVQSMKGRPHSHHWHRRCIVLYRMSRVLIAIVMSSAQVYAACMLHVFAVVNVICRSA